MWISTIFELAEPMEPDSAHVVSQSASKRQKVHVTGDFLRSTTNMQALSSRSNIEKLQCFMKSYALANFMGLVVLVDAYCTSTAIDARALSVPANPVFNWISDACLVLYSLEILGLIALFGVPVVKDWMTVLDIVIIACGWVEVIMNSIGTGLGFRIAVLRAMRLIRIFRLARLLKRIRPLKELHKLVMMMATCFRTLLWSCLLCFVVMTVWSMLMVETIYPALLEMWKDNGTFDDCPQCRRAMSSVMDANLLLFKTVIAGDSWGEIAVPVIQEYPATAVIFVGSLLTLVCGVLNVIVAVVVDTFAEARQNDVQNLAEEMEDEIEHDRKELAKLFDKIDKDGSGELTLQELVEGAREDPAFQSRLRVMDIDENDLEDLFHMIDVDQSGTVEAAEFIGPLSRWAHDSKTAPRFIKYNMLHTMHLQEDLYSLSAECFKQLAARIDELAVQVSDMSSKQPKSIETPEAPAELLADVGTKCISNSIENARQVFGHVPPNEKSEETCLEMHERRPSTCEEVEGPVSSQATAMTGRLEDTIVALLEASMVKLEAKLDLVLRDRRGQGNVMERNRITSEGNSGFTSHDSRFEGPEDRTPRPMSPRLMSPNLSKERPIRKPFKTSGERAQSKTLRLHPEAFRSMYLGKRGRRVSTPGMLSEDLRPVMTMSINPYDCRTIRSAPLAAPNLAQNPRTMDL